MFRMDEFIGISLQRLGDPREVARDARPIPPTPS